MELFTMSEIKDTDTLDVDASHTKQTLNNPSSHSISLEKIENPKISTVVDKLKDNPEDWKANIYKIQNDLSNVDYRQRIAQKK